jgi:sugar/nucleoside kinase (ribokinase family)
MTDRDYDIIVVGDLNPDLVLTGDVTPAFGQKEKLIDSATLTVGGSSAIFACGAARLGLRVAFMGLVGQDEFGAFMVRALAEWGVDVAGIVTSEISTGLGVMLSRGVDRAILTHLGSIGALCLDHLDLSRLAQGRHLHLGSLFLLNSLRPDIPRLFDHAHDLGLTISLDTNYDPAETWDGGLADVLARTDIFLPNATEARAMTGSNDPHGALSILARTVPTVAIKLGDQGAIAQRGSEQVTAPAVPQIVVDTTGAGDTFDAAFVYGSLQGWSLEQCLRLACACGSLSTRAAGGVGGQPTLTEALAASSL